VIGLLLAASVAWAHGPVARQAETALKRSLDIFMKEEKPEVLELFQGASVKLIAEETFTVQITLKDTRSYIYECGLDKTKKKWGCKRA
jgi:hypothetical protein